MRVHFPAGRDKKDLVVDLVSATAMHYPHVMLSELYGQNAPAFQYLITWESTGQPGLGAFHALDLPILFDTADKWSFAFDGHHPSELTRNMQDAWIAFARSGDPSHEAIGHWPDYLSGQKGVLVFDETTELVSDPLGWVRIVADDVRTRTAE